jgi:hypothetical protein
VALPAASNHHRLEKRRPLRESIPSGLAFQRADHGSSQPMPDVRPHPIRHTTTPAPASGGGSLPSCSSAAATIRQVLDVGDAERVDTAVEGIGDAAHVKFDPCIAELRRPVIRFIADQERAGSDGDN